MKKYYFIGNAHLDPVWMWRWQEGSAEAKATVRSALDRMKEYPDFKFVCSSASVYKYIEDFAPQMFEEMKERIEEGRFIIVGGQFVQPDCNLPSGEGFARQSLYSQRYFYDRFGKTAKVGYNVDSFGHNLMLPAILKKSGMDYYIFMRPGPHENALPANLFRWRSPDGSEVIAHRINEPYCYNMQSGDELEKKIECLDSYMPEESEAFPIFYGVGNHGGGPTKHNINIIMDSAVNHPERKYIFSDVLDYFESVKGKIGELYVHEDDLQHHASGCYSAVSLIKDLVRKSENALISAETANMIAANLTGKKYATDEIEKAWQNVLFCHFHDIIGGCSIEEAYTDASYMLGESISRAEKVKNSAYQTISWAIDTSDEERGYPIVIFNTLPFDNECLVKINKQLSSILSPEGEEIPIQYVHSAAYLTYGKSDTLFKARVPAMGYTVYYVKDTPTSSFENKLRVTDTSLENEYIKVEFDSESGYIKSIFDKENAIEMLSGSGAVPVVIDESGHDTWSHGKNFFTNEIGRFSDAKITVLEEGPVRATVMVESRYNKSVLKQSFSLASGSKILEVSASVDFHEEHKMLKIAFDTALENPDAYYEIPFGVIKRPSDGEEESGQRWFALKDNNCGYAVLNSNKYSFSAKGNTMYLTVIRSPYYADHGRTPNDRCVFTDQGEHKLEYSFMKINIEGFGEVIREAGKLNTRVDVILENNHNGNLASEYRGIVCNSENIEISAIKRSEDGKGTIIRVYETEGNQTKLKISGALLPHVLEAELSPYSINTYYLADGESEWREVLLTEFDA